MNKVMNTESGRSLKIPEPKKNTILKTEVDGPRKIEILQIGGKFGQT